MTALAPPGRFVFALQSTLPMAALIDRIFALIKWPVGVFALLILPGTVWALYDLGHAFYPHHKLYLPFLGGFFAYIILWNTFLKSPTWGSLMSTFEHELTHAVFAWATLHPVIDFKTTWKSGGHIKFRGEGNWLISIAPYFFPTASVAVALALIWMPDKWLMWTNGILGVTVAYHMTSTWIETHRDQPDLHKTTFTFALMFLPAANLVWYGLVVAFAFGGADATWEFMKHVIDRSIDMSGKLG